MKTENLDQEYLNKVWDILVEHAGAYEPLRENFLASVDTATREWRFQGQLGFGGKVWFEDGRATRVSCYPEDLTPQLSRTIQKISKELHELSSKM